MSEMWTEKMLSEQLNTTFEFTDKSGQAIDVKLVGVKRQGEEPTETLSILFEGPASPVLPHEMLSVKHPKLGTMELFVGPVCSPAAEAVAYEIVINRMKAAE